MKKALRIVCVLLVGIGILVGVGLYATVELTAYYAKKRFTESGLELATELRPYLKRYEEDRDLISRSPFFTRPSQGSKDAGPVLNGKILWEEEEGSDLALPKATADELKKAGKDWHLLRMDLSKLDSSWLAGLHEFDHWDIDRNSPHDPFKSNPDWLTMKLPRYPTFVTWAKIHLLKGRASNTLPQARRDVRQLARLVWTHDYTVSAMTAISILRSELRFAEPAADAMAGFEPFDEPLLAAAKRYFYSTMALATINLPVELRAKLREKSPNPCSGLNEAIGMAFPYIQILPEEMYVRGSQLDGWVKETDGFCRNSYVRVLWSENRVPVLFDDDDRVFSSMKVVTLKDEVEDSETVGSSVTWGRLKEFPTLRRTYGYHLATVASPNYFGQYRKAQVTPETVPGRETVD